MADHTTPITEKVAILDVSIEDASYTTQDVYRLKITMYFNGNHLEPIHLSRLVAKRAIDAECIDLGLSAQTLIAMVTRFYPNLVAFKSGEWVLHGTHCIYNNRTGSRNGGVHKSFTLNDSHSHVVEKIHRVAIQQSVISEKDVAEIEAQLEPVNEEGVTEEYTGGSSSYYQLRIEHPVTEGQEEFDVECLDIIRALNMDFELGNIFKAVWRIAAADQGKQKKGNNAQYDLEKIAFFAQSKLEYLNKVNGKED